MIDDVTTEDDRCKTIPEDFLAEFLLEVKRVKLQIEFDEVTDQQHIIIGNTTIH